MARLHNWRTNLHAYLAENALRDFEPGVFDCSLFSADCVNAITGEDPAADYRGRYATVAQGLALLQADGYADHEAFVATHFTETSVLFARAGDLAVVEQRGLVGIGAVLGPTIAVVTLGRGIGHVPLSSARRAFLVS